MNMVTRVCRFGALSVFIVAGFCSPGLLAQSSDLHALDAGQGWLLIQPQVSQMDLDEQIFTEISPIIDSPEAVRLPADQSNESQTVVQQEWVVPIPTLRERLTKPSQ